MEEKGKPSIRTQYQVVDGKIVALQADPECREMSRMVADLNRRVLRVQTHGQAGWEETGQRRGFGVEVAREAVDEEESGASGSRPYFTASDEPEQQSSSTLVEQYLEDVEYVEGKPGPVKRTLRRWVYGKPAAKAESCCCRQVEAVAGKMTIAEASGLQDEAVDRLLLNVYFHPAPKHDVASTVFRRASEVSKRMSQRVKSAARRISRRYTEYRAGRSGSTTGEVSPEADTVQLRRRPTGGPPDQEEAPVPEEGSLSGREERASSEEEQYYSARSSRASSEEAAGSSGEARSLQAGHNVGVYQVLLEAEAEDADDGGSNYQWPPPTNFTSHVENRKASDRKETLQEDESFTGDHHKSIMEDYRETERMQMNTGNAEKKSEQRTSNSEKSDQCICVNEKSKSPDRDCLTIKDSGTNGLHIRGEDREQQIEAIEPKVDLQLPESDQRQNKGAERRIVGSLDLYILNDPLEFDWEPVPENSEEVSLASQPMGGEEYEEDSLQNDEDNESSSVHSHTENQFRETRAIEMQDSDGSRKQDRNGSLPSKEGEEGTVQPERLEQNIQNAEQEVTVQPERRQDNILTIEQEVPVDPELVEENTQNVDNGSRSIRTVKGDRKSI